MPVFVLIANKWTARQSGHIFVLRSIKKYERMGNEEFAKKEVYLGSVEGTNRRGRPLGRWEDTVKEYVSERGVRGNEFEWARKECMDRERWRSVCRGHPQWGRFLRERGVRAID